MPSRENLLMERHAWSRSDNQTIDFSNINVVKTYRFILSRESNEHFFTSSHVR